MELRKNMWICSSLGKALERKKIAKTSTDELNQPDQAKEEAYTNIIKELY